MPLVRSHSRLLSWFRNLIFFAIFVACATAGAQASGPSLLFNPATGEILSQERAGEPWYPASLTKLMTSYVVFNRLRLGLMTLDQNIPVSALASAQPRSKIGLPAGRTVSVDFALQALLVYSANDMAYVLAEAAGGNVQNFVTAMNATAKRLGMTATHYVNPNGLFEPRQVTTARDTAILAQAIVKEFPEHAHYFKQPTLAIGKRRLANHNALIRRMQDADGMKTGFVCNSGFNLVASATRNGRKLVAIVFGAPSSKARADLAELLLVDGFARQPLTPLQHISEVANQPLGNVVPADMTASLCRRKPVTLVSASELKGWGMSLGSYDTAQQADTALRGHLLSPSGLSLAGKAGVIKLPGSNGFAAVVWDIAESRGRAACAQLRNEETYCNVMTPENFATLAPKVRTQ